MKNSILKIKQIIIMITVVFSAIIFMGSTISYLLITSSPTSGSILELHNYIQGDADISKLNGLNKAYAEKVDIKFGNLVSNKENTKVISAKISAPDMKNIIEKAIQQTLTENNNKNYEEKLEFVKTNIEKQLKTDCKMIEKTINVTMVKDGLKWKIVSDEEFNSAIDGNMLNILREMQQN